MTQVLLNVKVSHLLWPLFSSLASDSLHFVFVLQGLPSLARRTIRLARYLSQTDNLQTFLHR